MIDNSTQYINSIYGHNAEKLYIQIIIWTSGFNFMDELIVFITIYHNIVAFLNWGMYLVFDFIYRTCIVLVCMGY